jgi:uncharacterized protein
MSDPEPLLRPNVFVDTSVFFSVYNANDVRHLATATLFRRLYGEGLLVTTNFVVAETHALLLTKIERWLASQVLAALDGGRVTVMRVSEDDERQARSIPATYADKDFSLTDATSFAVMDRYLIRRALTFDHHFAQYGLELLGPE